MRRFLSTLLGALAVLFALLLLTELGLRLSGVVAYPPGQVCDRSARYFGESEEHEGAFQTLYWGGEAPEVLFKPRPKRETVMIFGGSNARSFGDGALRDELRIAIGDGARFQVVNLGRNGYGSERVRLVYEEALARFDPEVAVLYFGDNEFVESPWPPSVRRLPGALRDVHLARAVSRVVERVQGGGPGHPPEPWCADWTYYADFTYDRTLAQLDVLRENLRAMVETARERGVKLVICTVLYNRFCAPRGSAFGRDVSAADRRRVEELLERATRAFPAALAPLLPEEQDDYVRVMDWKGEEGDPPEARADGRRLGERPLGGMLADMEHILPEPELWTSKVWRLNAALERLHARELDEEERAALRDARGMLDEALALVPDHPRARFERGLVAYLLNEDERLTERYLVDAARLDRSPKMSSEAVNGILREVARENPEVLLVDVDERIAECFPGRLVGWEVMFDHCHVLPAARRRIMGLVARGIVERWYAER